MPGSEVFRKARRIELVAARLAQSLLAGGYRSVFRGQGVEFDRVREYVPGDDVRQIDWNVTSRMSGVYTKTFREERELNLFLVLDVSRSVWGLSDARREQVSWVFAILALAAELNNDNVGALFFSDRIERWLPLGRGRDHILRVIHELLTLQPEGVGSDLARALQAVSKASKRRGICVIVSDFRMSGYWRELNMLARRHDVILLRVVEPMDERFPVSGGIELRDPETGAITSAGASDRFRRQYREFWEYFFLDWRRRCAANRVDVLEIGSHEDAVMRLQSFFARRRRR